MGIIINKNAILCSGFTAIALWLGFNSLFAFILGAVVFYMPFRILFRTNVVSQTGAVASAGTIAAYSWIGYSLFNSFIFGAITGYLFLYWWVIFMPKLFLSREVSLV